MGKLYIANCLYAAFGLAFAGLLFCAQTPFGVAVCVTVITLCGAEIVVGLVEARKPIITRPERARGISIDKLAAFDKSKDEAAA